jgi:hydrogenase nickel incorporation protein HypA/HybF
MKHVRRPAWRGRRCDVHERSLAQALWAQAESLRREHRAARVLAVHVAVGELAGVEPELLRSAFDLLVASSGAAGTQIEMERVPLEARCDDCGVEFPVHRFHFLCPACGSKGVTVLRGEHLILQAVTLESAEDHDG